MNNIQTIIDSIPATAYNRNYRLVNLITHEEICDANLTTQFNKIEKYIYVNFKNLVEQMQPHVTSIQFGITPKMFRPIKVFNVIFYNTQQCANIAAFILGEDYTKFYLNKVIENRLITDPTNFFRIDDMETPLHLFRDYYRSSERHDKITYPISCLGQIFPSARAAAQVVAPMELSDTNKYKWVLTQIKIPDSGYFYLERPKATRPVATRPYVEVDGVVYFSARAAAKILHEQFGLTESSCAQYIAKGLREGNPRFKIISREEGAPRLHL